jgi:hypothetical protein
MKNVKLGQLSMGLGVGYIGLIAGFWLAVWAYDTGQDRWGLFYGLLAVVSLATAGYGFGRAFDLLGKPDKPHIAATGDVGPSDQIVYNHNGQRTSIFRSVQQWVTGNTPVAEQEQPQQPEPDEPLYTITVINDAGYPLTVDWPYNRVIKLTQTCYSKQNGKVSERYWTRVHRPRLTEHQFRAVRLLLVSSGVCTPPRERAAARLVYHPKQLERQLRNSTAWRIN